MKRDIVFTNDMDGVHFRSPPPLHTIFKLLRVQGGALPAIVPPYEAEMDLTVPHSERLKKLALAYHQRQKVKADARRGMDIIKAAAATQGRTLRFAILTGRMIYNDLVTEMQLRQAGYWDYFGEVYLNQGMRPISWKEAVARKIVGAGANVVHIDDDVRAGLCVARISQDYPGEGRVLVYVLRNLSSHPRLIKRAGLSLPDNLVMVDGFEAAAADFEKRLADGAV